MTRRLLIAGNWKLNRGPGAAAELALNLKKRLAGTTAVDIAVAPPFIAIPEVAQTLQHSGIAVGAQNVYWETSGAYTGEISGEMLRDAGCSFVLIGHSERRQIFGETNATVNRRLHAALAADLSPMLCVGETLAEREAGQARAIVWAQLEGGLAGVNERTMERIELAYEPVWAIGTGKVATPDQAQAMHADIRTWLRERFGEGLARNTRVLYGGSVKAANAQALLTQPDIDGALVGGASLNAESFAGIVSAIS
jgi:triosephosphate isomerase